MTPFSAGCRALLAAVLIWGSWPAQADDILFIGNSYTQAAQSVAAHYGGVPKLVEEIAKARGRQITTDAVTSGGKSWSYHMAQPLTEAKLTAKPWTWVVLQDHSDRLTLNGLPAFLKDGDAFYDQIVKASPSAKIVLYETWARPAVFFKGDAAASEKMIKAVHAGYAELQANLAAKSPAHEVRNAPVGSAFWAIEGKSVMDLHAADHHHANERGYYLAALVIYETIYHESVVGAPATFFGGKMTIPADDAKKLQEAADAAVAAN